MSKQYIFDRQKGFVALPVEILEIEMSPGAFRLLADLCRMANQDGYCWPSLAQLSEKIGRSKSTLSGYIAELREAGLVTTEDQRTSNGYNYRLKYCVTFWQAWRKSLTGKTVQKTERSVQPVERIRDSKKQSHVNHCKTKISLETKSILAEWSACFKNAPYPQVKRLPSSTLVTRTKKMLNARLSTEVISLDIEKELRHFWASAGVAIDEKSLLFQANRIAEAGFSVENLDELCSYIRKRWQSYWKKMPTDEQFEKFVKSSSVSTQRQQQKVLSAYLRRWEKAQFSLRTSANSAWMDKTAQTAF